MKDELIAAATASDVSLEEMAEAAAAMAATAAAMAATFGEQLEGLDEVENDVRAGRYHNYPAKEIDGVLLQLTGILRRTLQQAKTVAEGARQTCEAQELLARTSKRRGEVAQEVIEELKDLLRTHGVELPEN